MNPQQMDELLRQHTQALSEHFNSRPPLKPKSKPTRRPKAKDTPNTKAELIRMLEEMDRNRPAA